MCRDQLRSAIIHSIAWLFAIAAFSNLSEARISDERAEQTSESKVSYALDVKPIFSAHCVGCHQPAIHRGGYTMTDFESLMKAGDTGHDPIVPGKPDESYLVELISTHEKEGVLVAEMPIDADPLKPAEIETITNWIAQGAENDASRVGPLHDPEHPPIYARQPNIASLDFSPDGKLLAVTGFHEVLLIDVGHLDPFPCESDPITTKKTTGKIVKRLIGISPRIQSVKFSPDGKRLAVAGGNPGLSGEVQIWNVDSGELELSKAVSYDTVFGVSWAPDGSKIAFGCTDTSLRAIDTKTGKQVLFNGAHEDWLRDTVFSPSGKQLVSVGRDMSCKLVDVETNRFIDNITSITPGALKGGIASVAMHPTRDEIVIGGADGIPKVYRTNRITKRVIGDDANLSRLLPKMTGRIQSVAISPDGTRIAAASSLDGKGMVQFYGYEFDPDVPADIKGLLQKQPRQWNKDERAKVKAFHTKDVRVVSHANVEESSVYAIAFHPDSNWLAVGGSDGLIRFYEVESAKIGELMSPVEIQKPDAIAAKELDWKFKTHQQATETQSKPPNDFGKIVSLKVSPEKIDLNGPTDYTQLAIQAVLENGATIDVTDLAECKFGDDVISMDGAFVQSEKSGSTDLKISYNGLEQTLPVTVNVPDAFEPNFIRDVNPALTKLGCNAGTCHGSQDGKKGFKLSLRGYDPIYDVRSFTDDLASRRTNIASPHASLMLKKPAGQVPHEGQMLIEPDSKYYRLIHDWIAAGAKLDLETPRVIGVEVFPENPILSDVDYSQQMRVVATYADGATRDVTREAVIEIGDIEVAAVNESIVTALRRGETPVLARYEGAFTATTLTVMGKRDGYEWKSPETWSPIDEMVASKWQRMKIAPSGLCSDEVFIRRVYLDLTGLPPSADDVTKFIADTRDTRIKRDELVDQLVGNESFIDHWSNKWADLLQVNRKYLGPEGAMAFRTWIRKQVTENRPYDEFVYDVMTAKGSNLDNPAAAYYKIHRTPDEVMENTTHLFLATRFNCNKCHDHPFERWTQDQYYETAAFFAQIDRKKDPKSKDRRIGGSAVEGAKPLYEIIEDSGKGEVNHDRTGNVTPPVFPFESNHEVASDASRREKFAKWLVSADNQYFATSYVNRLWGYMMGVGLIEPLDDIRAGNPATNPQLLEYLRSQFIEHNFDTRHILKTICKSRTYQLSIDTNAFNADDHLNYSHAKARRLPAEVLFDSLHVALGSELKIPGVAAGTRAAALPDSGVKLPSGFLSTLGRPARESACECERANDLQLGSVLALVSGPDLARAIKDPNNSIAKLVKEQKDDRALIDQLFLRILNRHATEDEINITLESFAEIKGDHQSLVAAKAERTKQVAANLPKLQQQRERAIAETQTELDAAIAKLDPELLKKEAAQRERYAAAKKAQDEYAKDGASFDQWVDQQLSDVQWHPLIISKVESKAGRTYQIRSDRSLLFDPKPGIEDVSVYAKTDLSGITGVRLEALSDPALPSKGPGLAVNGNFVLGSFEVFIAHPDRPTEWEKVKISSAKADFEQQTFPIANAIRDKFVSRQGWAISPSIGKSHWATFQLEIPTGYAKGSLIKVRMRQDWDDTHQIGCFRISLTKYEQPLGLSLSSELVAKLASPKDKWDDAFKKQMAEYFKLSDPKLIELNAAVAEAMKPVPVNPQILKLREKLARVSKPISPDPGLEQLTADLKQSEAQLANERLTAAQDLAWALINSPSFLFNR